MGLSYLFGKFLIAIWLHHKLNEIIKPVPLGTWYMASVKPDWNLKIFNTV